MVLAGWVVLVGRAQGEPFVADGLQQVQVALKRGLPHERLGAGSVAVGGEKSDGFTNLAPLSTLSPCCIVLCNGVIRLS